MSIFSIIISVIVFIVGVIFLLFPNYSKQKFLNIKSRIRILGVFTICFAILFFLVDMKAQVLFNFVDFLHKSTHNSHNSIWLEFCKDKEFLSINGLFI